VSFHATQYGIAESTGIYQGHIPRNMKKLIEKKIVKETRSPIKGLERRRKAYLLTYEGMNSAKDILKTVTEMKIRFKNKKGNAKETKICKTAEKLKKQIDVNIVDIIRVMSPEGIVDYKDLIKKGGFVDFTENAPKPTHFYGREKEKQALKDFLKENRKIIVVYGMAGIGKSALLSKIIKEYKDEKNTFYYNIHEWDTLRSILETLSEFLQKMGKRKIKYYLKSRPEIAMDEIGMVLEEEIKDCKNTLLVFDDTQKANKEIINLFEYLREILSKTDTTLMVVGRKKLDFYDARHLLHKTAGEIRLNGLDKNSSKRLVGKKIADEDFEKIYSLTKGHPLALELVGRGKELEKQKDIMKYVYDEVYRKLTFQEKDLMFFVSVFNRPVPVDTLLQNNFNYENVQELIKKSLLLENGAEMVHLHDLLRKFFYNKSSAELRRKNHRKVAKYYENGKEDLDIIAAMDHHLKADDKKQAVKLIVKNGEKLINAGFGKELISIIEKYVDEKQVKKSDLAEILLLKGKTCAWAGEWDKSLKLNEKGLKLAEETGNKNLIAKIILDTGRTQMNKGEYKKALKSFGKALQISKDIGDMVGLNETHYQIGKVCWRMGNLNDAVRHLNLALKSDDQRLAGKALIDIGVVCYLRGDFEESIKMWMKALEIFQSLKDVHEIVRIYNNIGNCYIQSNRPDKAIEYYEKKVRLTEEIGWAGELAMGLHNLSWAYLKKGDIDKSMNYVEKALYISKRLRDKYSLANCYSTLGAIFRNKRNWEKSTGNYSKAIKIAREIGNTEVLSHTYLGFAKTLKQKGDHEKAKTQYQNALKCYMKLGNKVKIKEIRKELEGIEKI
jgi:tetratricopeptide (TPR) repeat protein